jgi:cytochrome c oxidase subunit 1
MSPASDTSITAQSGSGPPETVEDNGTRSGGDYDSYLSGPHTLRSWLLTRDHKRIGLLFLGTIAVFFAVGGLLALSVRLELMSTGPTIVSADTYNQLFTLHGAIMIFLFLIPAAPAVLGNFVLPLQLGCKDVAFPRLNLASWYLFVVGAAVMVGGILTQGLDTGWTFYAPLSTESTSAVIPVVFGIFVVGFSSIFTGLNFIVTIHKMRAPGLTWNRLPLFVWSLYATSLVQVLATPVLGITLLLLIAERVLRIGIFDPALGGDPVLFQHFFWFYSHPAVYIMILPGFGIISELIATFSRKRIFGYRMIALSSVAIALLGFLVWGHHMFVAGQSVIASIVFSLLSYMIGVPSGVKIFNWVATLYKGSIWLQSPMLYALIFLVLFPIGGFTGIMVAVLSVDVHLHDTYYVVGHFHYVMVGGMFMAFLGGLHYWWPKMFGRLYNEVAAKIAAGLLFVGFNLTFFPQLVLGARGMPRRYYDYPKRFEALNGLSTYGSWVLAAGLMLILGYLAHSLFWGKKAGVNPWGAATLEWRAVPTPPLEHNYLRTPVVTRGPYAFGQVDDLLGHDLTRGLSGDGEEGPVPELKTPQGSLVQEEPSPKEDQAR